MDTTRLRTHLTATILLGGVAGLLAGCDEPGLKTSDERARATIPASTLTLMESKGTSKNAPVLIRAYKKEAELEVWKMKPDGRYVHLKTFPMCRWSGQLGPKAREGDRQVPEGFYAITPAQMNPRSAYYLSFNVGYPNTYDRALGHSGSAIMVHGACSSAGCFSMTDKQIAEIYAIAREGFNGGQRSIQMQSYPFRMTAENLAKYRLDPNIGFWAQLKEGSDNFEVTKREVEVGVCGKRYVFNASAADGSQLDATGACPPLKYSMARADVVAKQKRDESRIAELVAQGTKPIRTVYADGGQHPDFASRFTNVSRPEALVQGPVDVAIDDTTTAKKASSVAPTVLAALQAAADTTPSGPKPEKPVAAGAAKPQESWLGLDRWFGGSTMTAAKTDSSEVSVASRETPAPVPPRRNEAAATPRDGRRATAAPRPPIQGAARVMPTGFSATVAQAQANR